MLRKLFVFTLSVLFLLTLAACSSGGTEEQSETAETPEAEVSETESDVAEEETDAEADDAETDEMAEEEEMTEEEEMAEHYTIGMMKIVSHPALDSIQAAFLETLAEAGYVEGENLTVLDGNAEGDIATLSTIAQQYIDEGVDLIATTSTPALQAAYNATKEMTEPIPIVFNAVTSPYAAGVATAPDEHPAWVIGTQIFPPIDVTFDTIAELMPDVSVIGLIYNPAEANSVAQTEEVVAVAEARGITLEIGTVSNSNEIKTAAEALVSRGIDLFYYSQDSTVATGLEGLVQVANDNQIPIVTNDVPGAGRGAAVAVGLDFSQDGNMSGQYAVGILDGTLDIAAEEIIRITDTEFHINHTAAELQNLELPQSLIDKAIDDTPE